MHLGIILDISKRKIKEKNLVLDNIISRIKELESIVVFQVENKVKRRQEKCNYMYCGDNTYSEMEWKPFQNSKKCILSESYQTKSRVKFKPRRSLVTCIHKQAMAIGTTRNNICQVTCVITPTIPISWIVVEANPPSLNGISRSTTL